VSRRRAITGGDVVGIRRMGLGEPDDWTLHRLVGRRYQPLAITPAEAQKIAAAHPATPSASEGA
jgi:hypothetical protein